MKRKIQVLSMLALSTSFHTNTAVKREQDLYFAKDFIKQSFLNLRVVLRQQGKEFDKQCVFSVN